MNYRLIDPAAILPITLEEARGQLRVFASGSPPTHQDDDMILRLMRGQTEYLDGVNGILNRALITQSWTLTLDEFPAAEIEIALPELQSVTSITYTDSAGDIQTIGDANFTVDPAGWIVPGSDGWPETFEGINTVTIEFVSGYGDEASDVPQPIRDAILLRVEANYDRDPNSQKTLLERADELLENFKAGGGGIG